MNNFLIYLTLSILNNDRKYKIVVIVGEERGDLLHGRQMLHFVCPLKLETYSEISLVKSGALLP